MCSHKMREKLIRKLDMRSSKQEPQYMRELKGRHRFKASPHRSREMKGSKRGISVGARRGVESGGRGNKTHKSLNASDQIEYSNERGFIVL